MRTSAKQVAARLRKLGYPILSVSEVNELENVDGEVKITTSVHVQVGSTYVNVVAETGEGDDIEWQSYPEAANYAALEEHLKKALAATPPKAK